MHFSPSASMRLHACILLAHVVVLGMLIKHSNTHIFNLIWRQGGLPLEKNNVYDSHGEWYKWQLRTQKCSGGG